MILGWSVVCSIVIWLVVNSMAGADNPESQSLGLYSCCCLLGYCLLPMIVFALLALIIPRYATSEQSCLLVLSAYVSNMCSNQYQVCALSQSAAHKLLPCLSTTRIDIRAPICRGVANLVLAVATTLWCGWTAAKLFSKMAPSISDQSMLVAYPCTLMYSAFALLTVY